MKKAIYIFCFTLLGFLLQLVLHGMIEIWYINLLTTDYQIYGLGLSWADWYRVHDIMTVILMFAGLTFGFFQGRYWWNQIYVLHRWGWGKRGIKKLDR